MKKIAIIYYSGHGNTAFIARQVVEGAQTASNTHVDLIEAASLMETPDVIAGYDGLIWGSPTYLGGVAGVFKSFMDATGKMWRHQQLRGKLASGFTISSLPSGDKQSTLLSMFVFSMQHGMIWIGNPVLPEQHQGVAYEQAANRLGSWSGLMVEGGHSNANDNFAAGDIRSARMFGENFSAALHRHAF